MLQLSFLSHVQSMLYYKYNKTSPEICFGMSLQTQVNAIQILENRQDKGSICCLYSNNTSYICVSVVQVARRDGDGATIDSGKQETEIRSLPPSPLRGVSPQRDSTLLAVQRALAQRHAHVQVREGTG